MAHPDYIDSNVFERAFEQAVSTDHLRSLELLARECGREFRGRSMPPEQMLVAFKARLPNVRAAVPGGTASPLREIYDRCVRWCIESYYDTQA